MLKVTTTMIRLNKKISLSAVAAIFIAVVIYFGAIYLMGSRALIPADINRDRTVDIFDLSLLLSKWGTADLASDVNDDGIVNIFDLSGLLSQWGQTETIGPSTIRMVSWNVGPDNPRDIGNEIVDFLRFADIMGMQELNSDEMNTVNDILCSTCAYESTKSTHTYDGSSPNKNLIVWKRALFTKVAGGFVDVSPTQAVSDGICTCDLPVKFIVWVKLKDNETDREFYVFNTHLVNGVESGGKPRSDASSTRLNNYKNHMNKIVEFVNLKKSDNLPIFSTGDYNANYRYDRTVKDPMFPYVRMGSVNMKSSFDVLNLSGIGSTPDRLIDYVWHWVRSDVTVKSNNYSQSTHGSDHYALYSTAEIN